MRYTSSRVKFGKAQDKALIECNRCGKTLHLQSTALLCQPCAKIARNREKERNKRILHRNGVKGDIRMYMRCIDANEMDGGLLTKDDKIQDDRNMKDDKI